MLKMPVFFFIILLFLTTLGSLAVGLLCLTASLLCFRSAGVSAAGLGCDFFWWRPSSVLLKASVGLRSVAKESN